MVLQCQKYMLKETTFQEVLVPLGEKMNIYATPTKGVLGPLMFFFSVLKISTIIPSIVWIKHFPPQGVRRKQYYKG